VYQLSEACRQMPGQAARGTMDPWVALDTDLRNIGIITGNAEQGARAADDIAERLEKLRAAPQPERKPTVFLFDSGTDTIFSSGMFGGPQGIIDAAGARNATEDVRDTWTTVSWERIATADPDLIVFVDYPGQTVEEKIAALRANPASRNLRAVRENRFINLPYAMWVSSPLNIDAAEILRSVLEKHGLAPESGITPSLDVTQLGLAGNDWLE
jgi:iron complex transport system substrate-binding protein